MAVIFEVRGDSLNARISQAGKVPGQFRGTGAGPGVAAVVVNSALTGMIGGSYIDLYGGVNERKALFYPGGANWTQTGNYSIVWRGSKRVSGDTSILSIGSPSGENHGDFQTYYGDGGTTTYVKQYDDYQREIIASTNTTAALTTNVFHDLHFAFNGTNLKVYLDGVLKSTIAATRAMNSPQEFIKMICLGLAKGITTSRCFVEQFKISDTVLDYTLYTGASRTDFLTGAAFDGQLNTGAGAANIRSGVSETISGVVVNGSMIAAAKATTKIGVTADDGAGEYDGSDRHTHAGAANIRLGVTEKDNSLTANVTGTMVAAAKATTKIGVAADDGTGEYVASERWTVLAESKVEEDFAYKANSETDNKLGTLHVPVSSDPGEENVLEGVAYMIDDVDKVGTLLFDQTVSEVTANLSSEDDLQVIPIVQGEDRNVRIVLKKGALPYSLVGATEIEVKILKTDETALSKKLSLSGVEIVDAANGVMDIILTDTDTASLKVAGLLSMEIIFDAGTVRRIFQLKNVLDVIAKLYS